MCWCLLSFFELFSFMIGWVGLRIIVVIIIGLVSGLCLVLLILVISMCWLGVIGGFICIWLVILLCIGLF